MLALADPPCGGSRRLAPEPWSTSRSTGRPAARRRPGRGGRSDGTRRRILRAMQSHRRSRQRPPHAGRSMSSRWWGRDRGRGPRWLSPSAPAAARRVLGVPGRKVRAGESDLSALVREIGEELGVAITRRWRSWGRCCSTARWPVACLALDAAGCEARIAEGRLVALRARGTPLVTGAELTPSPGSLRPPPPLPAVRSLLTRPDPPSPDFRPKVRCLPDFRRRKSEAADADERPPNGRPCSACLRDPPCTASSSVRTRSHQVRSLRGQLKLGLYRRMLRNVYAGIRACCRADHQLQDARAAAGC